jgi:putative sterol carrier protein
MLQEYKFNAEDWNGPPLLKKYLFECENFSCIFPRPDKNKQPCPYIHLKNLEPKDEENHEETDENCEETQNIQIDMTKARKQH